MSVLSVGFQIYDGWAQGQLIVSALGISFISMDDLRLFKNLTIDDELRTECALLDALMQRWTKEQAEAILYHIRGSTQEEIAIVWLLNLRK